MFMLIENVLNAKKNKKQDLDYLTMILRLLLMNDSQIVNDIRKLSET